MRYRLVSRQEIAEGTSCLHFSPQKESLVFTPGQFAKFTLINPTQTDARGNSRFFGLVDLPDPDGHIAVIFRHGTSAFKQTLGDLPIGGPVEVGPAAGLPVYSSPVSSPLIFVIGGIGIASAISPIRRYRQTPPGFPLTLIYSNTTLSRTIFLPELQALSAANPDFHLVTTMTKDPAWQGETTRLSPQFLKAMVSGLSLSRFVIAGTARFVPDMVNHLKSLQVDSKNIHFEIFSGY